MSLSTFEGAILRSAFDRVQELFLVHSPQETFAFLADKPFLFATLERLSALLKKNFRYAPERLPLCYEVDPESGYEELVAHVPFQGTPQDLVDCVEHVGHQWLEVASCLREGLGYHFR